MESGDDSLEIPFAAESDSVLEKLIHARVASADGDYYKILGLDRSASTGDVENAFRKLAPEVHPRNNPRPDAKIVFKALLEAFCVLIDADIRQKYDELGSEGVDRDKLGDSQAANIMDLLQHGQSMKNIDPVHAKIIEAGNDHYAVLGVDPKIGPTLTHAELLTHFMETESRLQIDANNIGISSLALNKVTMAWTVLGDEAMRREFDATGPAEDGSNLASLADGSALIDALVRRTTCEASTPSAPLIDLNAEWTLSSSKANWTDNWRFTGLVVMLAIIIYFFVKVNRARERIDLIASPKL